MNKIKPVFEVSAIKCNGWSSYSSLVSKDNYNAIQTFVSVFRKTEDFEQIVDTWAIQNPNEDYMYGRRCQSDTDITDRIVSALGTYGVESLGSEELGEMWINAQIEMFTGRIMTTLVQDAIRDCASADHWYTYEKEW